MLTDAAVMVVEANAAWPVMPSAVALIVTVPAAIAVTSPDADTVATAVLLDVQVIVRPVIAAPCASFGVAVSCAV